MFQDNTIPVKTKTKIMMALKLVALKSKVATNEKVNLPLSTFDIFNVGAGGGSFVPGFIE